MRASSDRQKASKESPWSDLPRHERGDGRPSVGWGGWPSPQSPPQALALRGPPRAVRWLSALRPSQPKSHTARSMAPSWWAKRPSRILRPVVASRTHRACSSLAKSSPALQPPTSSSRTRRATRLRYVPTESLIISARLQVTVMSEESHTRRPLRYRSVPGVSSSRLTSGDTGCSCLMPTRQ